MNKWASLAAASLVVILSACAGTKSIPTLNPIVIPPTYTLAPIVPTATLAHGAPVLQTQGTPVALPTAAVTQDSPVSATVVASHEAGGTLAVAMLTGVALTPGRTYQLVVSSPAGRVSFYGEWSTSAVGADGLPGVKVGLLDGATPVTYTIVPPVKVVAKDWLYSVSVQNKGAGGIKLTILDVTGK